MRILNVTLKSTILRGTSLFVQYGPKVQAVLRNNNVRNCSLTACEHYFVRDNVIYTGILESKVKKGFN